MGGCEGLWRVLEGSGGYAGGCGGLWGVVERRGGLWGVVEGCGGWWGVVEGCGGLWRVRSVGQLDTYLKPVGAPVAAHLATYH